ncbi:MAG: cytoskeleton protein RodZ [Rugosibacter sp.]|nr:cytoskeleton protein RodZ [Rugosibacter sp.]
MNAVASEDLGAAGPDGMGAAPDTPVALPGAALRLRREQLGLTVGAIAQATRFSPAQVEALECDDYPRLPGLTTARGFVRSYAKYVHMDPLPLLAMMDVVAPVTAMSVRPPSNLGVAQSANGRMGVLPKRLAAIGLVLLLVWVAYGAYVVMGRQRATGAAEVQAGQRPEAKAAATASSPASSASVAPVVPVPALQGTAVSADKPSSSPAVDGAAWPHEGVAMATGEGVGAQGASPVVASALPQAIAQPVLSLAFDGRSWVEVRDATNKVVLSGEFAAGTVRNVEGKLPFHVWVGQAPAVRVSLGERRIDLQPYARAGVARLTVQ